MEKLLSSRLSYQEWEKYNAKKCVLDKAALAQLLVARLL
jgi:hypothetical protein